MDDLLKEFYHLAELFFGLIGLETKGIYKGNGSEIGIPNLKMLLGETASMAVKSNGQRL